MIGRLNQRVTIRQPVETEVDGLPVVTWQDVATGVPADIRHQSGLEAIKADALISTVKASIRIRARSDITADMRVVAGGVTYEVKAVPPSDDRRWTYLACEVMA